jgi:hypothetical protein
MVECLLTRDALAIPMSMSSAGDGAAPLVSVCLETRCAAVKGPHRGAALGSDETLWILLVRPGDGYPSLNPQQISLRKFDRDKKNRFTADLDATNGARARRRHQRGYLNGQRASFIHAPCPHCNAHVAFANATWAGASSFTVRE